MWRSLLWTRSVVLLYFRFLGLCFRFLLACRIALFLYDRAAPHKPWPVSESVCCLPQSRADACSGDLRFRTQYRSPVCDLRSPISDRPRYRKKTNNTVREKEILTRSRGDLVWIRYAGRLIGWEARSSQPPDLSQNWRCAPPAPRNYRNHLSDKSNTCTGRLELVSGVHRT